MKKIIAFTGGGTAGHVFPGVAVYRALEELAAAGDVSPELYWIGSRKGMELKILGSEEIPTYAVPTGKLRRYFSFRNFIDIFNVGAGFFSSLFLFIRKRPALLFSKGGFVAVPPVLAASLLKIPVYIHESDTDPGLATRITSRFARKIFVTYEETKAYFSADRRKKVEVVGNPVRREIFEADRAAGRRALGLGDDEFLLFVMGGSLGAQQINDLVGKLAPELVKKCRILHQMGAKNFRASTLEGYETRDFIGKELPDILAASDVVISRAGAGSLWELAVLQKPMILIPLGGAASRGDQLKNADLFEKRRAARVLTGDVSSADLRGVLLELLGDPEKRADLAAGCAELSRIRADRAVARVIYDVLSGEVRG